MTIKTGKKSAYQLAKGLFLFIVFLSVSDFLTSCTPVCDYPSTRFGQIRPVNAMADQDNITIWLNGKVFQKDYSYTLSANDFGYLSQFLDGSPLTIGETRVTVTADAAGKDTLIADTSMTFDLHKQSLIVIGRAHTFPNEPNTKKILLLNDELVKPVDTATFVRFIHAIPDLPALDIYWSGNTTPDATVQYGQINGYSMITNLKKLTITEAGNPQNEIVTFNSPQIINGFVFTALIRGRTKPVDHEHVASAVFLSDVASGFLNNLQTFGIRLMNAARNRPKLSLLIQTAASLDTIRHWFPHQNVVLDIGKDSLSDYMGLRPELNGNTNDKTSTTYFFSPNYVYRPDLPDTLDHFQQVAAADERYTFVAVDTIPLSKHIDGNLDHLILRDTISPTLNPAINRVRIIHVNPDHPNGLLVKVGNTTRSMGFKGVAYMEVPTGSQSLELNDGTSSKTIPISVVSGRPMSIYLLPDTDAGTYPVKIITE